MFQVQLSKEPDTSGARQSKQLTRDTAIHCVNNQETGEKNRPQTRSSLTKNGPKLHGAKAGAGTTTAAGGKVTCRCGPGSGTTSLPLVPARPSVYPEGGAPTTQTSPPSDGGAGRSRDPAAAAKKPRKEGRGPKGCHRAPSADRLSRSQSCFPI